MGKWVEQGFVANSVSFYKEQLQKIFIKAFGDDFLLDDTLPQGILITALAEWAYGLDMDGVEGFSFLNPNTATGIYLDFMGNLRGMPRNLGTPQLATLVIKCNPNNFIPFTISQGHEFTTVDGNDSFKAVAGKTISEPETTLSVEYMQDGNSNATVGTKLQTIGFPNIEDIEISYLMDGIATESDAEYRTRIRTNYPAAGQTVEYILNKIRELPFVKAVGCNYNDTAEVADTLPAYSTEFMAVPIKGADPTLFKESVASIILNNKVPGSPTAGNTTVTATDVFGTSKEVKFTIPTEVPLQIRVQVSTPEETGYVDLAGVPEIIIAIAKYINGLEIGKDVSYSRCMAPLTADAGFDVANFQIRPLPKGENWVDNKFDYALNTIVRYNNQYYYAVKANPVGRPDLSADWAPYEEGWINNQNYAIAARQYATITEQDIAIGA